MKLEIELTEDDFDEVDQAAHLARYEGYDKAGAKLEDLARRIREALDARKAA